MNKINNNINQYNNDNIPNLPIKIRLDDNKSNYFNKISIFFKNNKNILFYRKLSVLLEIKSDTNLFLENFLNGKIKVSIDDDNSIATVDSGLDESIIMSNPY